MELLLRTSFDIPKPPGGGLFDREYPHFAARQIFYWSCQFGVEREKGCFESEARPAPSEKFWIRPEQWSIELLRYISFKISSLDRCSKLNMEMKRILFYATLKSCRVFKSDGIVKRYDLSRNKTLVKQDCHFNRQLFQILPSEGAFLQQKCWQLNWDE